MDALALTPAALSDGSWWRLWTCHLAHYDAAHALTGALACAIPLVLLPRAGRIRVLLALLLIAPLIAVAALLDARTAEYRGASGLATALWASAGSARRRERIGVAMLALLGAFLLREAWVGVTVHADWVACAAAHRLGALLGALAALTSPARRLPPRVVSVAPALEATPVASTAP